MTDPTPATSVTPPIKGTFLGEVFSWMKAHPWSFALAPIILLGAVAFFLLESLTPSTKDEQKARAISNQAKVDAGVYKDEAGAAHAATEASRAGITIQPGQAPQAPTQAAQPGKSAAEIASGFNEIK